MKAPFWVGSLARYSQSCGWVLCVGAGISKGIFPDWNELAEKLIKKTTLTCSSQAIKGFIEIFGPEALMQTAYNILGDADAQYVTNILSEALYAPLQERAAKNWGILAKALTSSRPANLTKEEWTIFINIISEFSNTSAREIASIIANIIDSDLKPSAIISFNAEPLLYALINYHYGLAEPDSLKRQGQKILDRLSHDLV